MGRVFSWAVSLSFLMCASGAFAVDSCKSWIDRKTGTVYVNAKGVEGALTWRGTPEGVTSSFFNSATCVTGDKARKCVLADVEDFQRVSPPERCTMYLVDNVSTCSTYIKGCTPGLREGTSSIAALQELVSGLTRPFGPYGRFVFPYDVMVEGANLQITDGSGSTCPGGSGKGNVIIGYNEDPNAPANERSGSHNLVVGPDHTWTAAACGGILGGKQNTIANENVSVTGGATNTASGLYAVVSAGKENQALGIASAVSGGRNNKAYAGAAVSGGNSNTASGLYSVVSGGQGNSASSFSSAVSGGSMNTADANHAVVSGGRYNEIDHSFYLALTIGGGYGLIVDDGTYGIAASSNGEWHAGQRSGFPSGGNY